MSIKSILIGSTILAASQMALAETAEKNEHGEVMRSYYGTQEIVLFDDGTWEFSNGGEIGEYEFFTHGNCLQLGDDVIALCQLPEGLHVDAAFKDQDYSEYYIKHDELPIDFLVTLYEGHGHQGTPDSLVDEDSVPPVWFERVSDQYEYAGPLLHANEKVFHDVALFERWEGTEDVVDYWSFDIVTKDDYLTLQTFQAYEMPPMSAEERVAYEQAQRELIDGLRGYIVVEGRPASQVFEAEDDKVAHLSQ